MHRRMAPTNRGPSLPDFPAGEGSIDGGMRKLRNYFRRDGIALPPDHNGSELVHIAPQPIRSAFGPIYIVWGPISIGRKSACNALEPIDIGLPPVCNALEPIDIGFQSVGNTLESTHIGLQPICNTLEPVHIGLQPVGNTLESIHIGL